MAQTVAEYLINRFHEWGVNRIFGYPGDGINGFMAALRGAEDKVQFIQTRHEEMAAFMACAHAKFTDEVGVCMATSGPGAIHLLNGLYDAKMDHQPVVAIVGQQARSALGGSYQQEVDLITLFKDVAGAYVHMACEPSQTRHLVDRAIRIALAERTVTCIIFPNDLQELDYEEPKRMHGTIHSSVGYKRPRIIPHDTDLQQAAAILNEGEKVAMLVGAGAKGCEEEIIQVADILGCGVAKALLGKAVLPDDLPFVTGSIGLLGTGPSWDMMTGCDTLLMVGSSFPYSEFLPKEGQAKAVQIDIDGKMLGIRYPMTLNLQGDSKATLQALIPYLKRKEDRSWRTSIEDNIDKWWKILDARAQNSADPINPQYVYWELSKRLPDNCILSADSGSTAAWFARDLKVRTGMKASLSGNLATMCPGMPYTIAAKFAYPDRVAIGLIGDGAMQMLGINGLITVSKYWKTWKDPRMIILVLNNRDLNMVSWEQRVMIGDAKFDASQDVPDFAYDEYAKLLGLEGIRVDNPADVKDALDTAMVVRKPVVLNVYTDPDVPMTPPHVSLKEMKAFSSAIFHGDSDSWDMIKQTAKDVWSEYFPGKG
ncbi:thiamine pyrophosphate-requiring protein [Flavisolibacter ginsenosidimutans]|uniref:Thiamine pyrophosphate-requiring protein n=1 Tax=Flavisolibacter ginsenosidimutans TaxID=661481 RepID=A0A5B8UEB9_9BACT|nr:thiamine pyrophosphate-requiring protein [Flavisolibacter ginsenosidimutans]QEC54459.1 thiamine pyrophosphate-requiring protein [Flavisolibacter ginsenosidimutans]